MNRNSPAWGITLSHLSKQSIDDCFLHKDAVPAFTKLHAKAATQGFDLRIASGFRSFDRQLAIWNQKALGERAVLDAYGQALALDQLSEEELLFAILRWSALPGASRHHWGSDIDIYDGSQLDDGYLLKLELDEYERGGPCADLSRWLTDVLADSVENCGFRRPYARDSGGVAPEPWHLSYEPVAKTMEGVHNIDDLRTLITSSDIALKSVILKNIEDIYERFIAVPASNNK